MKVPFNIDTVSKCICYKCPVQIGSPCAKKGIDEGLKIKEAPADNKLKKIIPQPKSVSGVYCSSGESPCNDLDFSKLCTCPVCEIFSTYALRKNNPDFIEGFFCGEGSAE
jgi:hypothetical protein